MGNSEFIQEVLFEAGAREKETLRLSARVFDLSSLARDIVKGGGITESELRSGSRKSHVSRARKIFCHVAVNKMGHSGAESLVSLGLRLQPLKVPANSKVIVDISRC